MARREFSARALSATVLALAAVTAALLLGALGLGYEHTHRASELVARGQAEGFLHEVRESLRGVGPVEQAEPLEALLRDASPRGLRYVALVRDDGAVLAHAGTPSPALALAPRAPPGAVLWSDDRARVVGGPIAPSGPHAFGGPPPPEHDGPPPPPPFGGPPEPPPFGGPPPMGPPGGPFGGPPPFAPLLRRMHPPAPVVEFEPTEAASLRSAAATSALVGAAAVIVLLAIAAVLARVLHQRERLAERLEREHVLAVVGEMSAVLAHELRNPLAALKGHAQLLLESFGPEAPERSRTRTERVIHEAMRLESLTNDLLELLRTGELSRAECDATALLEECARAVDAERIAVQATGSARLVSLDGPRMREVLVNVLENAVQASPPDARVEATVEYGAGSVRFTVRDHGKGLAEEDRARAFEPFFTRKTRGIGLGLALSRRIVELHGGTIALENAPDGGAIVTVSLPEV